MKLQHTVKTAFKGLRNNKTRSLLTVLGIVIGVAAIIAVTAVGDGAESLILEEISGLGQETAIVIPGDEPGPGGPTIAQDLTQDDLDALRSTGNVPNLIESYGFVTMARQIAYQNETYRPTMLGGSVSYLAETLDVDLDAGRFLMMIIAQADVWLSSVRTSSKTCSGSIGLSVKRLQLPIETLRLPAFLLIPDRRVRLILTRR